jgi:hypothetical protein
MGLITLSAKKTYLLQPFRENSSLVAQSVRCSHEQSLQDTRSGSRLTRIPGDMNCQAGA